MNNNQFIILLLLFLFSLKGFSQNVGINDNGNTPNSHAILDVDVSTNNKGVLIPRLTTAQRTGISGLGTTDEGLTVYDETTKSYWFWDGSAWVEIGAGSSSTAWDILGNSGTSSGTNFLGTTNNQALDIRTNNIIRTRITTKGQIETLNTGNSVFVGEGAGDSDDLSTNNNVFVGYNSGNANTSGDNNTALGYNSLKTNTTSTGSTAMGSGALASSNANGNSAFGFTALNSNTSGANNSAFGIGALYANNGGGYNTAFGSYALYQNTSGQTNVSVGYDAMHTNSTGNNSTAIGANALWHSNGVTNTAIGYGAGYDITSGSVNVIVGDNAGTNLTTAKENVFVGHHTGYYMQTGSSNTAIGYNALYCYGGAGGGPRAGGNGNVAIGKWAMFNPISGDHNVAIGYSTYSLPNTGSENVFIGYYSDRDHNSDKNYGVAIGSHAVADADYATAIGYRAYADNANTLILGQINGVNSATSSTSVGIGTTNPTSILHIISPNLGTNEATVRIGPVGGGSSTLSIPSILDFWSTFDNYSSDQGPRRTACLKAHYIGGVWGNEALSICVGSSNDSGIEPAERVRIVASGSNQTAGGSWTTLSDKRLKTDIKDIPYGLNDVMKIKPLKYIIHDPKNFNDIPEGKPQGQGREEIGFIAQDLYKIIPDVVTKPKDETKELWSLSYERMVPVLVKAIQEQQEEINKLKQEIKELKTSK